MICTGLLTGEKVRLTAIDERDIPIISSWYSDADFLRYFDKVPAIPKSIKQIDEWINAIQSSNNTCPFAIRDINNGEMVGYIELGSIQWWNGTATMGIGIGTNAERGKGYGKEALKLLLDFAFKELNLHRVQLNVFSYNQKAINLYEKLGFKHEGTYREFIHRDGKRWDMYLYGILENEWSEISNNLGKISKH